MSITKESAAVYQPSDFEGTGKVYKVISGDSLSKIANVYDVSVAAIKATNNLSSDTILIGQELLIPVNGQFEVQGTEYIEQVAEEVVSIEPLLETSIKEAEPETSLKENLDIELDMESLPQVEILRIPAQ